MQKMRQVGWEDAMGAVPFLDSGVDYLEILRGLDEGVIITDGDGRIVFFNEAQARMDGMDPDAAIGKMVREIWDVTEDTSITLRCLQSGKPMVNQYMAYRTRAGRIVNSINSVFPIRTTSGLAGSIAFVRGYNLLEETITSICSVVEGTGRRTRNNGTRFTFQDIVGESPTFLETIRTAKLAALTPSQVMVHGDTGTGKELFAQAIHNYGARKDQSYVGLNCAAIPENLLEGLLFGTTRGAFTGATDRPGLFEKANGGSLYLDEINSMALGLQAKLLRVLQERRVRRVGSLEERPVDVKLISSVNEDPHHAIEARRLRLDLFYRLGVVMLHVPPLRERSRDIGVLTRYFINKYNQEFARNVTGISAEVDELFRTYPWPGNVRELEHTIEGAMNLMGEQTIIDLAQLPTYLVKAWRGQEPQAGPARAPRPDPDPEPASLSLLQSQAQAERRAMEQALAETGGNLSRAAALLGLSRQRLAYRLAKHGLDRAAFRVPVARR
jgi:arginine utilization regulatory protein